MRLRNDQIHIQAQLDQVEATPSQYANMKSKRKVRKVFCDTNMAALIVVDFKNQIKEGIFYISVICNRFLYKISVILFKKENYDDVIATLTYLHKSYDDLLYMCEACNKVMRKKFIPCQAVFNNLNITFLTKEFQSIHKLERVIKKDIV